MANLITKENLTDNMLEKLKAFNNEGAELNPTTIHSDVLATSDGFPGSPASATLYRGAILWTLKMNGGTKVTFPSGWLSLTVDELADFIISKQKY